MITCRTEHSRKTRSRSIHTGNYTKRKFSSFPPAPTKSSGYFLLEVLWWLLLRGAARETLKTIKPVLARKPSRIWGSAVYLQEHNTNIATKRGISVSRESNNKKAWAMHTCLVLH